MSFSIYVQRKRQTPDTAPEENRTSPTPGPPLEAIAAGISRPSTQQMGRRVDLQEALRQKMENAFGTDFSNVRFYESEAVAQAGAEAITQGNQVAFAPGMMDFSSQEGQARLGHELSHVASQARGDPPVADSSWTAAWNTRPTWREPGPLPGSPSIPAL